MNIQTEHLDNHTARLTVEVEAERVEQAMRQAARRIAQKGRIPGFRPGKAPYQVVLSMYGREFVLSEALNTLGNQIYREALEQTEIHPYAPGSMEDIQEGENSLTLIFTVPKFPSVNLGNYREIRVPIEPPEITDEMVEESMENLRQRAALLEPADDRPARLTDLVTFGHIEVVALPNADAPQDTPAEAAGSSEPDGEPDESNEFAPVLDAVDRPVAETDEAESQDENDQSDVPGEQLVLHEHDFKQVLRDDADDLFPGFSAQIVGMSVGEAKTFELVMPADYEVESLSGHTLHCDVVIAAIQSRTVPEWSDLLAEQISEGELKTILELRMDVRERLKTRAVQIAERKAFEQALEQMIEGATLHYPQEVVDEHIDSLLNEFDQHLREENDLTLEDFVRITSIPIEQIREQYRPAAVRRAERVMVLGEMIRQEQLGVSDADIETEINQMLALLGGSKGEVVGQFRRLLMADESRFHIGTRLLANRATKRLIAIAKGENPPLGPDPQPEMVAPDADQPAGEPALLVVETADAAAPTQPVQEQPEVSE